MTLRPAQELEAENVALRDALKDCLRMLEAVRFTAGLGKGQNERIARHKTMIGEQIGR